jgi:hypothetical protein
VEFPALFLKEESMNTATSVANDVLHPASHSSLTAEEIAKAVAHHNRHLHGQDAAAKPGASKKSKKSK